MIRHDRVLSTLGMAARARKIADGGFSAEKSVKSGRACLVVLAADASENTRKQFQDMCSYYHVPVRIYGEKETLGHAIGKELRSVIAVLDPGFANAIEKQIKQMEQTEAVEWQK